MSINIEGNQVQVIDFHVHTFPEQIAPKAIHKLEVISGLNASTNGTIQSTKNVMQKCGIDHAILLNIATSPTQQSTINSTANEINLSNDIFTAFGSVHFLNEDCLSELDRIKSMGIRGIKLHPDYQDFMIDDERMFPLYEKCEQLGLMIVFHAGWDCYSPDLIHAIPSASRNVIDTFKKLDICLAHFGGIHCWDDVEKYLVEQNVYFDVAMCNTYADKNQIERMIKQHDDNKVLFGSDCPWENPADTINFVLGMNISNEYKEKIFNLNAKKLLSI